MANPEQERRRALDDLFSLVYEELRKLASSLRRHELHATLSTTALVHEAWMKLKDSPHLGTNSAPHFKAIAARAMRQILVEEAKHHLSRCTTLPMERLPMPRKCLSLIRPYNS